MKKVYLLITAICLTALTGCIKEDVELTEANVSMSITTRLDLSSLSSKEQGDAIADINVWAFACNANGEVSNAEDPAIAWRRITTANTHTSVDVHLQFTTCKDDQPRYYKLVAVINKDAFGTIDGITTTDGVTTFDRSTTYNQLANATFVAPEDLMKLNPGHGPNSTPGQMPISHWTIIELKNDNDNDNNNDTHPGECYNVSMPVYRALAKTQLLVAKSDENSTVTIKNVTLGSSAYPTEGALLSAAVGQVVKENNTIKALDFATPGDTTPQWYVSSVSTTSHYNDVDATDNEVDIFTSSTTNTGAVSAFLTADDHGSDDVDFDDYQYITSYFLYENKGGSDAWNTASTNGGYYMDVTYDAGAGNKTERVWLPAVVRNHDIQVRALVNAGGELTLKINVKDWTEQPAQLDFKDYVTFSKSITWAEGTNFDSNNNHIVQLGTPQGVAASFSFKLDAPVGGKWYAELITKQGKANAFSFSNTAVQATTSGKIGEEATLTIYTTAENYGAETPNVAELRITARGTIGGVTRTFRVDMGTAGNYQIKQAN